MSIEPLTGEAQARLRAMRLRGVIAAAGDAAEEALVAGGLAERRGDRIAATTPGIAAHAAWALVPPGSPGRAGAEAFYGRFQRLNRRLLETVSRWQVTPAGMLNDHSDQAYDLQVLDGIEAVVSAAGRDLAPLAATTPRFAGYAERLETALRRVERGEHAWLASPAVDSVHTVWMELHADILDALGASRLDEEAMP